MKLEVGMYAYSKKCRDYGIGKVVNITENGLGFKGDLIDIQYRHSKHAIENHDVIASFNIIDILEVGDILVNDSNYKLEVLLIDNELMVRNLGLIYDNNYYLPIKSIVIKSIVTKEQFVSMKYELKEWNEKFIWYQEGIGKT